MLVTCPDCEAQVSDLAPACPKCGRPRATAEPTPPTEAPPQRVLTTEDSALTRSRGCADLILWPLVLLVLAGLVGLLWLGSQ